MMLSERKAKSPGEYSSHLAGVLQFAFDFWNEARHLAPLAPGDPEAMLYTGRTQAAMGVLMVATGGRPLDAVGLECLRQQGVDVGRPAPDAAVPFTIVDPYRMESMTFPTEGAALEAARLRWPDAEFRLLNDGSYTVQQPGGELLPELGEISPRQELAQNGPAAWPGTLYEQKREAGQ